jgi:hypothetical protein
MTSATINGTGVFFAYDSEGRRILRTPEAGDSRECPA